MRLLTRVAVVFALLAGPAASAAEAVTLKDLVDLKKAGISDAVLVALIDSDASVFQLTATDVRALRDAGFSDSLIIAMLNTAVKSRTQMDTLDRAAQQAWTAPLPPAQVWSAPPQADSAGQVPVYAEPTIPAGILTQTPIAYQAPRYYRQVTPIFVPVATPMYVTVPVAKAAPKAPPVYWGFGGAQRPDSWKEPGGGK